VPWTTKGDCPELYQLLLEQSHVTSHAHIEGTIAEFPAGGLPVSRPYVADCVLHKTFPGIYCATITVIGPESKLRSGIAGCSCYTSMDIAAALLIEALGAGGSIILADYGQGVQAIFTQIDRALPELKRTAYTYEYCGRCIHG